MNAAGNDRSSNVGFIGMGVMGGPLVGHLARSGVPLVVYDADQSAVQAVVGQGAEAASDVAEVARRAGTVVCMLPTPDVFREVTIGDGGLKDGLQNGDTVIDMSTDGPTVIHECRSVLLAGGVELIDSPVGRGPDAAGSGDLVLLTGGEEAALERVRWLLEIMGSTIHHCGPSGSGQVVKLANNLVSCTNVAVIAEAHELARRSGADLDKLYEIMINTAADSWQLRNTVVAKALKGDFSPMFKLRHAHKDLVLIRQLQDELEARAGCTTGALDWHNEALEQSFGDLDSGALTLMADPSLERTT